MGRLVYRKRMELDTMEGMLRKVASAIRSHRDLRAYLADVPKDERESFIDHIAPLLSFEVDGELIDGFVGASGDRLTGDKSESSCAECAKIPLCLGLCSDCKRKLHAKLQANESTHEPGLARLEAAMKGDDAI